MTSLERLEIAVKEAEKLRELVAVEILILVDKVKRSQVCPVCKGAGQYYTPPAGSTLVFGLYEICQGCGGLGRV